VGVTNRRAILLSKRSLSKSLFVTTYFDCVRVNVCLPKGVVSVALSRTGPHVNDIFSRAVHKRIDLVGGEWTPLVVNTEMFASEMISKRHFFCIMMR